ncbi:hypothetical protein [Rhodococcus tibetensis]|uniref:DUF4386 family protein n=1 Tax=Rhodococcus tibetensis TaxID=2965064 RepID=A0ABT1QHB7_9NOCA|nr:hypothetical protein [Rhodococcus sp. FXJ9.536]MCQ4121185.1 hypothetical protein [Rhodococcus sp. FXJ9.536]
MDTTAVRIGGLCGVAAALIMIPAYMVGTPDRPTSTTEAEEYYSSYSGFVTANGVVPLLHVLFFLFFLGILVSVLRRADRESTGLATTALAGGIVFVTLTAVGFAAEVAYPATLLRFDDLPYDEQIAPLLLTTSSWLYHYCQVGTAVMILATSVLVLRTGVLPRWTAAGAALGVLALLHTWIPLVAALGGLLWIAVIGLLLAVRGASDQVERSAVSPRLDR